MNKFLNYIGFTNLKFLLIMLSVMAYDYVYNIGLLYTLAAVLVICAIFHNINIKVILLSCVISLCLSFMTYQQNGRMMHRYLLTYENGTSICSHPNREIDARCFSRGKEGAPNEAGDFIKHEYIGKSFLVSK